MVLISIQHTVQILICWRMLMHCKIYGFCKLKWLFTVERFALMSQISPQYIGSAIFSLHFSLNNAFPIETTRK